MIIDYIKINIKESLLEENIEISNRIVNLLISTNEYSTVDIISKNNVFEDKNYFSIITLNCLFI